MTQITKKNQESLIKCCNKILSLSLGKSVLRYFFMLKCNI